MLTQQLRGDAGTKAARIPVSKEVTIDSVTCRKALVGRMARTFAGPAELPVERCVTMKAARFVHDVSQYRSGPVTPSKVSMMIMCP